MSLTVSFYLGRDVPDGDLRAMPPQVYLAELKTIASTGLSFDPESKGAGKPKGWTKYGFDPAAEWLLAAGGS